MNLTLKTEINSYEVIDIYQQSKIGLILSGNTGENSQSGADGANYSSCEYLLCGLPVVTTPSQGGRNFWFDDYNSITCEPNADSVNDSVNILLERLENNKIDRLLIRNNSIKKIDYIRNNLINKMQELFDDNHIKLNAQTHFKNIYFHKMITYNNITW